MSDANCRALKLIFLSSFINLSALLSVGDKSVSPLGSSFLSPPFPDRDKITAHYRFYSGP